MYLLGLDLGTSSIKASVVDSSTGKTIASTQYPETEVAIDSPEAGWAEQSPDMWWDNVKMAIKKVLRTLEASQAKDIKAIGISYQMHGLVVLDANGQVLRPSIIWCDSRAVPYGAKAFDSIGHDKALANLLNSPGNFTASKLAWVKENQPDIYAKIAKVMLPGDFIAYKLTGNQTLTETGLSEGIFWDFKNNQLSEDVLSVFGFDKNMFAPIQSAFSNHGQLVDAVANEVGLQAGIPVTYKAGDQPNNALSLNVLEPGEVAATAGTSGVVYAVTDQVAFDPKSRVNTFAHVNHNFQQQQDRLGVLLCINGTGILNRWVKDTIGADTYVAMNEQAEKVAVGSNGLSILPFGNGAERVLENKTLGADVTGLNFNIHTKAHIYRAAQEGIAFSLKYGLDIMYASGNKPSVIRAGKANMFLSSVFAGALVNAAGVPVELYDTDGAKGAALGAGIGLGLFNTPKEAFANMEKIGVIEPNSAKAGEYAAAYGNWLLSLENALKK
jgi:xylulokinase